MDAVGSAAGDAAAGSRLSAFQLDTLLRTHRRRQLLGLLGADLVSTNLAFVLAYHLRYTYGLGGDIPGESLVEFSAYVPLQLLFVGLCLLSYQLRGNYALPRAAPFAAELLSILGTTAVAAMAVFAFSSMIRYPASSRLTFIYVWLASVALGVFGRMALRALRAQAHQAGYGIERVIVAGGNHLARMLMQVLTHERDLGYRVLGFVDDVPARDFGRFRCLGNLEQLPGLIRQLEAHRVIVALPASQHQEILQVLEQCRSNGVGMSLVPDLFELRLSHVSSEMLGAIPVLDLKDSPIEGWNLVVKRALDVAGGAGLLVLLSPLFLLVAALIKIDSAGPVFYRQTRVGKGGAVFQCMKFRSMRVGADLLREELDTLNEAQGPLFKIRADPRLTRVGRLIRRTSLDELPQLWNVLRGEMSLVGPRPPLPEEVERYEDWHRRRLEVVPGITGLWQVSGRSELTFDEMVMLDLYYIENWSLGLDLQILARTLPTVLAARGAF
jgi:exopolysaccharide biosynthesis polyprenyl glycosylphosphotransferase